MIDVKVMVDAAKQLNQTWKSNCCNGESVPREMYDCMNDVDVAIANLIDKIGNISKAITVNDIYK